MVEEKFNDYLEEYVPLDVLPELPDQCFRASIDFSWKQYSFCAYPGPEVVDEGGRQEHLPYHCHVEIRGKTHYKIGFDGINFVELGGKKVPKGLKKYLTKTYLITLLANLYMILLKKLDMNF